MHSDKCREIQPSLSHTDTSGCHADCPERATVLAPGILVADLGAASLDILRALERVYDADCPGDTNGDGDCGKPDCPYCGEAIRQAIAKAYGG